MVRNLAFPLFNGESQFQSSSVNVEYARTSMPVYLCPFALSLPSLANVTPHSLSLRPLNINPTFPPSLLPLPPTRQRGDSTVDPSMKLKSIILAATGLLALVVATPTVKNEGEGAASSPLLTGLEANSIDVHAPPSQCYLNCHLPWEKCKKECGRTERCDHLCNCKLFSNPKQMGRSRSNSIRGF